MQNINQLVVCVVRSSSWRKRFAEVKAVTTFAVVLNADDTTAEEATLQIVFNDTLPPCERREED